MSSKSKSPPDPPVTFFLDRCLGRGVVAARLRDAGHSAEVHADHFPDAESEAECDDSGWLREVGARGWVILSKDKHFTRNQIEIVGLLESGAASFILTGGQMTGDAMAATFLSAMPQVLRLLRKFDRPFVAQVTAGGNVRIAYTRSDLIKEIE